MTGRAEQMLADVNLTVSELVGMVHRVCQSPPQPATLRCRRCHYMPAHGGANFISIVMKVNNPSCWACVVCGTCAYTLTQENKILRLFVCLKKQNSIRSFYTCTQGRIPLAHAPSARLSPVWQQTVQHKTFALCVIFPLFKTKTIVK